MTKYVLLKENEQQVLTLSSVVGNTVYLVGDEDAPTPVITEVREQVLEIIRSNPGKTSVELRSLQTSFGWKTWSNAMEGLRSAGLVKTKGKTRTTRYWAK